MNLKKAPAAAVAAAGILYAGYLCLLFLERGSIIYPGIKT
jgi:hypothetical protein